MTPGRLPDRRRMKSSVQANRLAVAVGGEPAGDGVHNSGVVDGDEAAHLVIVELVERAGQTVGGLRLVLPSAWVKPGYQRR